MLGALVLFAVSIAPAQALITFQDDVFDEIDSEGFFIDFDGIGADDIIIQFGNDPILNQNAVIRWDVATDELQITNEDYDDLDPINERANLSFEIENVTDLEDNFGVDDSGRIVILKDNNETVAPGCTVPVPCTPGSYVWSGSTWTSLDGVVTSNNLTKVVTVDTGVGVGDFTTIELAADYLVDRSGGIMLLSAETHDVTTNVTLENTIIIGKDASRSTINVTAGGKFSSLDSSFEFLTLQTTGDLTAAEVIDVQTASTSLRFNFVDFDIDNANDVLVNSTEGVAPTTNLKIIKSAVVAGSLGDVLLPIPPGGGTANLNAASLIFVDSRSGDNPLEFNDWPIVLAGGGSVSTTGIITPVPADTIIVSDQMNLQGAIDSIEFAGDGGQITLLPGNHALTSTLTIQDDNIVIQGFGDASVISVSGIATGATVAAIQMGTADGTSPVDGVTLKDFKLEVTGTGATDIHGIRTAGGTDLRVDNVTVQKISGTSGSAATAHMGIHFIDGTAEQLVRPVIINCRVFGNGGANYFTDGIHVTSDGDIGGVFGNDQGVINALLDGNNVDFVAETAYVFVGVDNSSLFNNRATNMAAGGGGYGIFMGAVSNVNMTANVFSGSQAVGATAIGIDSFNSGSLKQTTDSIFNGNIIDGFGNAGVGFATGFQIGNATNVNVLRNSFQNNTVAGAPAGATIAFDVRGNVDSNAFSFNNLSGGVNPWDTGFNIQAAAAEQNLLLSNRFTNVTVDITDVGTATLIGSDHHRDTVAPGVTDDSGDGYDVGDFWIDETANTAYVLVDSTVGAADWNQIDAGGGGSTLDDAYNSGQSISVDGSGDLIFNLNNTEDFLIQDGGVTFATFTDGGDFDLVNNLTVGANSETIDDGTNSLNDAAFGLDGDDVFVSGELGVEGQIYSDALVDTEFWLDIGGGRTSAVQGGGKIGSRIPVLRFDPDGDSRGRWSFNLPNDYVEGDLTFTVLWSPSNTDTGNVNWEVEMGSIPNTELLNAGDWQAGIDVTESANGTTNQLQEESFVLLEAEITADDTVYFMINRDGADAVNDTFTGNVDIHAIRVQYLGKRIR
ncbi:MAG: hypothetical protein P1V18_05145 [Candidatus Gracilibacteria bacterium]|nr:hypothetical protein [Candidatus Gracilibacteria bacterium]